MRGNVLLAFLCGLPQEHSSFKVKGLLHVLCVSTRESVSSSPSRLPNTFLFHKVVLEVERP